MSPRSQPIGPAMDGSLLSKSMTPRRTRIFGYCPFLVMAYPIHFCRPHFAESQAFFSPDGRWLAYTSNESGRIEVYVQTFPQSGGKWLISSGGGSQPHWRGDGKELFYVAPDKTLMAVDIKATSTFETSAPKPLFATQVGNFNAPNRYVVTPDGQRFLVNSPVGEVNQTPITVV